MIAFEVRSLSLMEDTISLLDQLQISYVKMEDQPLILTRWQTEDIDRLDIYILIGEDEGVISATAFLGEHVEGMEDWMLRMNHKLAFSFFSLDDDGYPYINCRIAKEWLSKEALILAFQGIISAAEEFKSFREGKMTDET